MENCTSIMARCHYFIIKTISNFMQRRFRQALGSAKRATKLLRSMSGFKEVGDFYYYHCLSAYCCWCAEGSKRKKDKYHALLKASRAKLGKWVSNVTNLCFKQFLKRLAYIFKHATAKEMFKKVKQFFLIPSPL